MRYVALDLGDKRTGLAVGDAVTGIASPLEVVEMPIDREKGEALLRALAHAMFRHFGEGLTSDVTMIVGLPLNMDGTEGPRAILTRKFAERLAEHVRLPMELVDERLTSVEADDRMARTGLTHGQKKKRRDALAAQVLLQGYLEQKA